LAGRNILAACLFALVARCAPAQDELRVQSPKGKLEFRLLIAEPEAGRLFHLAYQVLLGGKRVLDTSYLGVNVHDQEPVLGENVALTTSTRSQGTGYSSLIAQYLQNGTVGRRLNLEVRVWDDGVAFRYVIPTTAALNELLIEDEMTEFSFVKPVDAQGPVELPFVMEQPGTGWVGIYEAGNGAYPRTNLVRTDPTTMITRLVQENRFPRIAYDGKTPFTGPWRMVITARDREGLMQTNVAREMVR
jgi:alpha-glucosidase